MRRSASVVILGALVLVLLGSYVVFSQTAVSELRRDAGSYARMYARVFDALSDTSAEAGNAALLDLAQAIRDLGVPVVVTDASGHVTAAANLPFRARRDDPRILRFVQELDRQNPPVVHGGGRVHFGDSTLVKSLRIIPVLQAALLALVFAAGVYTLRTRSRADREHVWAGMARESAHQLATPLSSLSGWLELLRDRDGEPIPEQALDHMQADLERLERVAHRFERIGRPPRRDPVDMGELAERVARYFQARVPTLAHRVTVTVSRDHEPLTVEGDAVLLEWALEALAKNALDALAGRGGHLHIAAERAGPDRVRVRIIDDGPGIPREIRHRIFEPGFSTKRAGWGIGLSLARRIIEEHNDGTLVLAPTERGATFDVILRL